MKIVEIRAKSDEQLKELYEELAQKRRELSFKLASDQLKSVREVRKTRKTMAQIKTIMKERKSEKAKKGPAPAKIKEEKANEKESSLAKASEDKNN